jgi:hypothetical protein
MHQVLFMGFIPFLLLTIREIVQQDSVVVLVELLLELHKLKKMKMKL